MSSVLVDVFPKPSILAGTTLIDSIGTSMSFTLLVLLAIVVVSVIDTVVVAVSGWLFGAPMSEVRLFMGPSIPLLRIKGAPLTIEIVPIGGSVRFASQTELGAAAEEMDIERGGLQPLFSRAETLEDAHPFDALRFSYRASSFFFSDVWLFWELRLHGHRCMSGWYSCLMVSLANPLGRHCWKRETTWSRPSRVE